MKKSTEQHNECLTEKTQGKVSVIGENASLLSWDVLAKNSYWAYFTHAKPLSLWMLTQHYVSHWDLGRFLPFISEVWMRTLVYLSYMNCLFVYVPYRLLTCDPVDKLGHHYINLVLLRFLDPHHGASFRFHWMDIFMVWFTVEIFFFPKSVSCLVPSGCVQYVRAFKASNSLLLL